MSDVNRRGCPPCRREAFSKGKMRQHLADDGLFDRLQPAPPPGPDGRADVIEDGYAGRLEPLGQAQVEVGRVDEHGGRGRRAALLLTGCGKSRRRRGRWATTSTRPTRARSSMGNRPFDAGPLHLPAADAEESGLRPERFGTPGRARPRIFLRIFPRPR